MNRVFAMALVAALLTSIGGVAQSAKDKLAQGIAAYDDWEWETAITLLNEALQLDLSEASQIEAYKYLGFCSINTNRPANAKQAFENLLRIDFAHQLGVNFPPKYLDVFNAVKSEFKLEGTQLLQKGIDAYNELEFKDGVSYLESALKKPLTDNQKIAAYQYLAFCHIEAGQIDKAKSRFQKLLARDENYALGDQFPPKYREIFNQAKGEMKEGSRRGIRYVLGGGIVAVGVAVVACLLFCKDDGPWPQSKSPLPPSLHQ